MKTMEVKKSLSQGYPAQRGGGGRSWGTSWLGSSGFHLLSSDVRGWQRRWWGREWHVGDRGGHVAHSEVQHLQTHTQHITDHQLKHPAAVSWRQRLSLPPTSQVSSSSVLDIKECRKKGLLHTAPNIRVNEEVAENDQFWLKRYLNTPLRKWTFENFPNLTAQDRKMFI